jgi:hypothetical protein
MQNFKKLALASSLSALALLAACGGGDDEGVIVDEKDPEPTGLTATATISAAGDAALNGTYSTTSVRLNNVTRVNPIGADPETCRFKFEGLVQAVGGRVLGGDVRYLPDSVQLRTTFVNVDGVEFVQEGTTGAAVDRANNRVVYTGAVLNSTQGTGRSITFTGTIPMLGNRPGGC